VMLPLMFAFFALQFPSGVSLYWVVNSLVGIAFNILTYGFPALGIEPLFKVRQLSAPVVADQPTPAAPTPDRELRTTNGPGRNKRQNRRRRP